MKKSHAKFLGRWCKKHRRAHERVVLPDGLGGVTGCRECIEGTELLAALEQAAAFVRERYGTPG